MKKILLAFFVLFSLSLITQSQETVPTQPSDKPKVGRYVQTTKEVQVEWGSSSPNFQIELTSVDVLNEKEMKINFIVSNIKNSSSKLYEDSLPPFFIVDENLTKYRPIDKLKADWDSCGKRKGCYILGATEKVRGSLTFPVLVEGARKFDLYFGYDKKIPDIQLIE